MKTSTARDNGASVSLALGEELEIRLSENPTTGYRWQPVDWQRAILDLTRDDFEPPDPSRLGAGGLHCWRFVARAPGQTSLGLAQRRGSETPVGTFSLVVTVA